MVALQRSRSWFGLGPGALDGALRHGLGLDLFPSLTRAVREYRAFRERCRSGCDGPRWSEDWFAGLQRKYRPSDRVEEWSNIAQGTPRRVIGLSLSLLPAGVGRGVKAVFEDLGLTSRSNGELFVLLKELGEIAKHHGDVLFPELWPYLVDWQLSFGAEPTTGTAREEFKELLRSWVYTPKPEDVADSLREVVIFRGLERLRGQLMPLRRRGLAFADWLRAPSRWLVNGASTVEGLASMRKNKFSTYLARSDAEMRADLHDNSDPAYTVFDKRERGKHRNLVSAPWSLYLQMSFLGDVAEDIIYDLIPTSLSRGFGVEHWLSWQSSMHSRMFVPIDQSKFDHVPSGRVLDAVFRLIVDVCCVAGDDERALVGKTLLSRLKRGSITYEGLTLPHRRGVLSGWRWTALVDTVLNYAEYLGVCADLGLPPASRDQCCFQGDDALFPVSGWSAAADMVEAYRSVLPVNPGKFFLRRYETEYLRLVLTPKRRFGYFARVASGLMHSNAWSGGKLSAASIAATWSTVLGRGADRSAVIRRCAGDLAGMFRCTALEAHDLLGTPASVGGLGYWDVPCRRWVSVVTPSLVGTGGRMKQGLSWDDLPHAAKTQAVKVLSERLGVGGDEAQEAASQLVMGLELKGARSTVEERSVLQRVEQESGTLPARGVTLGAVRPLVDGMFLRGLLRVRMRNEDASYLELFSREDHGLIIQMKRVLPRAVWFDWLTGGLTGVTGKRLGDAGDVLKWIGRAVDVRGCLPAGNVTTQRVRLRRLRLEAESAMAYVDLRTRMRS